MDSEILAHLQENAKYNQVTSEVVANCVTREQQIDALSDALEKSKIEREKRSLAYRLYDYATHSDLSLAYRIKSMQALTKMGMSLEDPEEIGTFYSNLLYTLSKYPGEFKGDWNLFLQKTVSDFSLHDLQADEKDALKHTNQNRLVAIEEFGINNIVSPETIKCVEGKLVEFGLEKIELVKAKNDPALYRYFYGADEKDVQRIFSLVIN